MEQIIKQQPAISIALSEEQVSTLIQDAIKDKKIEINTIVNQPQKQWYTVDEAAKYIGVERQTIYQYVSNYRYKMFEKPCLKHCKVGSNVRIRAEWLDELCMNGLVNRHLVK